MEGLRKLKSHDYNRKHQENLPDGSIIITLSSVKYPEVYRFRVKGLYTEDEEVLEEEVIRP